MIAEKLNKIIPSTKLKVITVHKLWSMSCSRKYFWRWILNLEPKRINLNYWYGGVWGAGFESLQMGKSLKQAFAAMSKESKRRTSRYGLTDDDKYEICLQMKLLKLFVKAASKNPHRGFDTSKMKMEYQQIPVRFRLQQSRLLFCGTMEGEGTFDGRAVMFENKTAKVLNENYFNKLNYDKQIHSYALTREKNQEFCPNRCCYCILRKVQKKIKKKQTEDDFINEIADDLQDIEKRKWYFIMCNISLGATTLRETESDLETGASRLKEAYERETTKSLLNPHSWEKNDGQCLSWRGCEYMMLCRYPERWRTYINLFQQREMLYKEERKELQE